MTDRWIDLDGAVNVRDLGGLPVEGGGRIRPGVIVRADNLQDLSEQDVRLLLGDHGVRTVLDLRTPDEVAREGPGPLVAAGVRHVNLDLIPGWGTERAVPHEKREKGDLSHFYIDYLDEAPDNVVAAMRVLADPSSGPSIVHCAAGKDRTGVICALALRVAGVAREDVVEDYALTGERIVAIRDRLAAAPSYAEDMRIRTLDDLQPRALSMRHFLDRLDERGGTAGWLTAHGFGPDEQAALRSRMTA